MTDWVSTNQNDLLDAVMHFTTEFPGWWYSMGECSISCHASCGPDVNGQDAEHLKLESRVFDEGFHADLAQPSTLADALRDVAEQARKALQQHRGA